MSSTVTSPEVCPPAAGHDQPTTEQPNGGIIAPEPATTTAARDGSLRTVTTTGFELAQVNIGTPVAPLDSEQLAGFVAALEPINALADNAPGFIWRLTDDDGSDATGLRIFGRDDMLLNMSVWRDVESLGDFVFRSMHVEIMRQRRSFFVPMTEVYTALWWVPRGVRPTVSDAEERLLRLREHGPTPLAFTFRTNFPPPDALPDFGDAPGDAGLVLPRQSGELTADGVQQDHDWFCPA